MNAKTILVTLILGLTIAAVGIIIVDRSYVAPPMLALPEKNPGANREPPQIIPPAKAPQPTSYAASVSPNAKPDDAVIAIANAIDRLTSPKTSFGEKRTLLSQLRKAGELDDVIAGLKELAADSPGDATIPITLGEAEMAKIKSVAAAGGDETDVAVLALQATQNFNQALKIDPTNWEAQFAKAANLSFAPPALNKGPEVIQMLSSLITQQETMPSQPQFALTYLLLGQQYQAAGQTDKAIETWQQGAAQFPSNPSFQKNLAGASAK